MYHVHIGYKRGKRENIQYFKNVDDAEAYYVGRSKEVDGHRVFYVSLWDTDKNILITTEGGEVYIPKGDN